MEQRAVAEAGQRLEVVADEHDRLALRAEAVERREALLLEALVADGEHLVEQEDVEVDLDRDRVREPDLHPGGEVLQLLVDEALELGERDDLVEASLRARFRERPSSVPLIRMLSRAVSSGLKPTPSSMNGESSAVDADVALVLPVDAGEIFSSVLLPLPFGADDRRRTRRCSIANETSSSATWCSYVVRRNGCRKYSLNVVRCWCGSRKRLAHADDLDRDAARHQTRSANQGSSRRKKRAERERSRTRSRSGRSRA